jgi:hypothetical protein
MVKMMDRSNESIGIWKCELFASKIASFVVQILYCKSGRGENFGRAPTYVGSVSRGNRQLRAATLFPPLHDISSRLCEIAFLAHVSADRSACPLL